MNTQISTEELRPKWLGLVEQQVESLRFGVVQIVVHDNRVMQIEKTKKVRLDREPQRER